MPTFTFVVVVVVIQYSPSVDWGVKWIVTSHLTEMAGDSIPFEGIPANPSVEKGPRFCQSSSGREAVGFLAEDFQECKGRNFKSTKGRNFKSTKVTNFKFKMRNAKSTTEREFRVYEGQEFQVYEG